MAINSPLVSVIIPTLGRSESLHACLASIARQTYRNFEAIIVDAGKRGGTSHLVDKFDRDMAITHIVRDIGLVPSVNLGWRMSTGQIITRTDDDVVASPDWLAEIVSSFHIDLRIGGVTGPSIIPRRLMGNRDMATWNEKLGASQGTGWRVIRALYHGYLLEGQPFAVGRVFKSGAFSIGSSYEECTGLPELVDVDHLDACNWSARRDVLEAIGGFDESYIAPGDYHEMDAAFRIRKLGYRLVFNPEARVDHMLSEGTGGLLTARPHAYGKSRNFVMFYFRHIKPNTADKFLRFSLYLLLFYNGYWLLKFITTRKFNQLAGIWGTWEGMIRYAPRMLEN